MPRSTKARIDGIMARIAEDPTDDGGFMVLSDALQEAGDPRGLLIALHHAGSARAAAHLQAHAEALLGPALRRDLGRSTEVQWHLGFVREATVTADEPERLARALTSLLESPSAVFLQHLILRGRSRAFDYRPAIRLLKRRGPKTLSVLRASGRPGAALDPSLLEAFPRLDRPPAVVWDELGRTLARIGDPRRHPFHAGRAAAELELVRSGSLPGDALLTALCLEIDRARPLGVIDALKLLCTPDSLDRFTVEIVRQWDASIELRTRRTRVPWVLLTAFGGPGCVSTVSELLLRWAAPHRIRALEALDRIGTDRALFEIARFRLEHPGGRDGERAEQILARRAERAGIDPGRLVQGLRPELTPADREQLVQRRLERWMVEGHRIAPAAFRRTCLAEPVEAGLARQVVWGLFDREALVGSAVLAPEGLVDAEGRPVTPGRGVKLGIAHPVELGRDLGAWRARAAAPDGPRLAGWQIERPTAALPAADRQRRVLTRRVGGGFDPVPLRVGGWQEAEARQQAAGTFRRPFARDGATVVLTVRTSDDGVVDLRVAGHARAMCDLHPVTLSEVLAQVGALASARPPRRRRADPGSPVEGDRVVLAGTRVPGTVFWIGDDRYGDGLRYGVRGDDGETYWVGGAQLYHEAEVDDDPDQSPIGPGDDVFLPEQELYGIVFWAGRSKYGDGDRFGVKGEDGETYWVDGDRIAPA